MICNDIKIIRKPAAISMFGLSKSTFHNKINDGLIPPSISLGPRAKGFIEHELKTVLIAVINEKPDDEIRETVKKLVDKRAELEILL